MTGVDDSNSTNSEHKLVEKEIDNFGFDKDKPRVHTVQQMKDMEEFEEHVRQMEDETVEKWRR